MRFRSVIGCAAIAAFIAVAHTRIAHTEVIGSESFAISPGPLSGMGSGSGWAGNWITGQPNVFQVQAASLTGAFTSAGGSLLFDGSQAAPTVGARAFRQIDLGPSSPAEVAGLVDTVTTRFNGVQPALGRPGTTVWLGIVFHGGTAGSGVAGVQYLDQVHLYNGATTTPSALSQGDNNKDGEALAIGRGNGNTAWNYERTCGHDNCPNSSTSSTSYVSSVTMDSTTHWVVMRYVFISTATTQITMWLDPAPGGSDPTDASALSLGGHQLVNVTGLHFNWIELGGQTSRFAFDELRLATTFAEVSALPAAGVPRTVLAPASIKMSAGPSPFGVGTTLSFDLSSPQRVDICVLAASGRTIRRLEVGSPGTELEFAL